MVSIRSFQVSFCFCVTATFCPLYGERLSADETAGHEFFESRIRPVLVQECYECHSAASAELKGGLRLDWRDGLLEGGDNGAAIVPGKASESLLIDALRHVSFEMPPEKVLDEAVIADFTRWIDQGAFDPRNSPPDPAEISEMTWEAKLHERRAWWSLQPVEKPEIPAVRNGDWPQSDIDQFILAGLEEKELSPAPQADRATLIRRLTFNLTGLPPTPNDVEAFVEDDSPQAWETLVDRLLASPQFGERFARHWMDVVRYTDTYGYEWDIPVKDAWRYRDYLIRALNDDIGFDQLIREHLAGDLLENPRINKAEAINESLIGLAFYQMGEKRHGDSADFNGVHQEMLDDKINTFSKAFQALTVTCAKCHNHKLDAVAQREYYALAGVFMSSRWVTNTLDLPERNQSTIEQLQEIKTLLRVQLAGQWLREIDSLDQAILNSDTELPLEDVRFPWFQLKKAIEQGSGVPEAWQSLAEKYKTEQETRTTFNTDKFTVVADFRAGIPESWSVAGVGLDQITDCGDFTVALEGDQAIGGLVTGGLFTHTLSPRLNGALRTPYLYNFDQSHLSFEVTGGDLSAHRTVFDNGFLTERQFYLDSPNMSWLSLPTLQQHLDHKVYLELATKTLNPNFPPRMGLGRKLSVEEISNPTSWFGVSRVLAHNEATKPQDELKRFSGLFDREPPKDMAQVAAHYQQWLRSAVEAWQCNEAGEADIRLINWLLKNEVLSNDRESNDESDITQLVDRYRQVEQQLKTPQTINGMADLEDGFDYHLNIRGDYDLLGDQVPRGYLQTLTGKNEGFKSAGSGRLELAELIASPENPLTARVFVNRVWHWLFGSGIVATPNNFGKLGQTPTHPHLLDYLATRFVDEGWSVKRLVRMIVLSETWRQGSEASPQADLKDPDNRLLHHYSLRRLEAEAVRDAILATSGGINLQLYGPPVDPPRVNEDPQKRLVSGPIDGNGRRSLYTKITIMEPPQFLAVFNQPQPKIPTGKRDVSNTPLQSLALLNDNFVNGEAGHWAKTVVVAGHASVEARLEQMFLRSLGRLPTAGEIERWNAAVREIGALHDVSPGRELASELLWKDIAHALFNTKEFIYIR